MPLWPAPTPKDTIAKLPAITSEGKMTFGCLVDGKVFVTKFFGPGGLMPTYYESNGYMAIRAHNNYFGYYLSLSFNNMTDTGFFNIDKIISNNSNVSYTKMTQFQDNDSLDHYYYIDSGYFHLFYLNEDKGIFSGQFSFNAKNDSGQVVRIRDGRFDVRYKF